MDLIEIVRNALSEDLTSGEDVTTRFFVARDLRCVCRIEARHSAVISGMKAATAVFREVDSSLQIKAEVGDGAHVEKDQVVMHIGGLAHSILRAERTALNFLGHLSGVATKTFGFVKAAQTSGTKILCTRKTTPGLRDLEMDAVRHGGGDAYRTNLSDSIFVKDNHLALSEGLEGVGQQLARIRERDPEAARHILEAGKLEVDSLEQLDAAVEMGWHNILLDNFSIAEVNEAVRRWKEQVFLEVSGGVNSENIIEYASAGVDAISVGALTHSVKSVDFSLEVERS